MQDRVYTYSNGLVKFKTLYKHTQLGIRKYTLYVAFYTKGTQCLYDGPFHIIDINAINVNPGDISKQYVAGLWSEYGYMKDDSKLTRTAITSFRSGKNIGKKNETSSLQQAINDAISKYNKKLLEGLTTELPKNTENTSTEQLTVADINKN